MRRTSPHAVAFAQKCWDTDFAEKSLAGELVAKGRSWNAVPPVPGRPCPHISRISIAIWSSADLTQSDLPEITLPQPFAPTPGWFAISLRARRIGDFLHTSYPSGAFAWLDQYQPVERVGKTILLYHIPENGGSTPALSH